MTTKVGFFLYNPFPALSVASAVELIRCANSVTGQELYSWEFFTIAGEDAYSATGFHIRVHGKLEDAKVDVLIVCATNNAMHSRNAKLFVHLRRIARRGI